MKLIAVACLLPLALAIHSDPRVANVERFYDNVKKLVRKSGYVANSSPCDPGIKERLMDAHEKAINDGYKGIEDAIQDSWGAIFGATISICKKIRNAHLQVEEEHKKCVEEKNYIAPENFTLSVPYVETVPYLKTIGELMTTGAKFMNFTLNQAILMDIRLLSDYPKPCLDEYKENSKKLIKEHYAETMAFAEITNTTVAHIESETLSVDDKKFATKYAMAPGITFFTAMCTLWLDLKDPNHYGLKGFYERLKECQKNLENGE